MLGYSRDQIETGWNLDGNLGDRQARLSVKGDWAGCSASADHE
jgi:hypothetical protein